ncbi:hypothetical protein CEXT_582121 [Caerostris extrusa]|uniref:Ig-like domain-containing protein n=1 Tax=Caerostris extrusa TaxID=172846 RepID=A0AAV4MFR1_CAEEX|nr:hypothetical protein CEXT_582121 [Caerostris extrusa]
MRMHVEEKKILLIPPTPSVFSKRSGSKMIFPGSSRVHPQPPAEETPCATWRRLDSSRNVSVRLLCPVNGAQYPVTTTWRDVKI